MRAALQKVPREFNPSGAVTLIELRLGLMERDYGEVARILAESKHEKFNDSGIGGTAGMIDSYSFSRAWYEGLLARAQGDEPTARLGFERALSEAEEDLTCCANDVQAVAMRALIRAALGNKEQAINDAERSVKLLPISRGCLRWPGRRDRTWP